MPYQFSYNIMNGISSVYSSRTEEQLEDGPLVGSYSYLRPDGVYMTVMYVYVLFFPFCLFSSISMCSSCFL